MHRETATMNRARRQQQPIPGLMVMSSDDIQAMFDHALRSLDTEGGDKYLTWKHDIGRVVVLDEAAMQQQARMFTEVGVVRTMTKTCKYKGNTFLLHIYQPDISDPVEFQRVCNRVGITGADPMAILVFGEMTNAYVYVEVV
jgi:hypothetical protein